MNSSVKCIILVFVLLSGSVNATSESEQEYYLKIKSLHDKADKKLNDLYKIQMKESQNKGAEFYGQQKSRDVYLKKAQQAWIKMRDASCDYETYESQTGTGFSTIYEKCLLDKTNERIKYLEDNY